VTHPSANVGSTQQRVAIRLGMAISDRGGC
jgi:hypothetical protein